MGRRPDPDHVAEVEAWRAERYRRLRQPMSWLTLVGLEWLRDGDNRLGTGATVEVRIPSGPSVAARLRLHRGRVTATAEPGSRLTHEGVDFQDLELVSDEDAPEDSGPTLLELGALRMCLIRRGARFALRVWDTESPALATFDGIPHYAVDPAWRIEARFAAAAEGETIAVTDVTGDVAEDPLVGSVVFDVAGASQRLSAVGGGDGRLWLIFADDTNRDTTYGGGRYLYTDAPRADGTLTVDFNRAYNPPCVFSPYATCPLPPAENRLAIRVEAGERRLT